MKPQDITTEKMSNEEEIENIPSRKSRKAYNKGRTYVVQVLKKQSSERNTYVSDTTTEHQSYKLNTKVGHRTPRGSKTYVRQRYTGNKGPLSMLLSRLPVLMSLEYAKEEILMLN